jgi:signal transduction histidine kinase
MDILGQSALLVGVTSFALGFSVLARNVRNTLFLSFAMLATLISAWSLSFFLDRVWPDLGFYQLHLLFNVFLAPICLFFIRVMVRIQNQVSQRLLAFSIFVAVLLSLALLIHLDSAPWVLQLIYFTPGLVVLQTLQLMWIDRSLKKGAKRIPKVPTVGLGRRNLIYMGAVFVLLTSVMDHVPWIGPVIPAFGNIGLAVYIFFLSQAITQQRLLNMSALFSRFLVLLAVALTFTAIYSLLVSWIENSPGLFFLNSFIASFLILMLLEPLRTMVAYFTQRLLPKRNRKLLQTLREAQRRLTGMMEAGALFQSILATAEQTLQPEWAGLFVLRSDGTRYRRVRTIGQEPDINEAEKREMHQATVKEILADHVILQYCGELAQKGKFPVLLDQILENEMDRSASRLQREHFALLIQGLKALKANLLIPLFHSGKVLGFVAFWVPSPPEPWGNNWGLLPIIYPYFEQAAKTMQNMEIYARQREKERLAALGEMAAGLAHEIRNPLGAIKGAAQFLDPSANRPESRFLEVIVQEVDRLNRVVTQFLDYSKPPTADFQRIDLSQVTQKTLDLLKPSLRPSLVLEFHPSRIPAPVMASAEQIRQVIINLVQNAENALEKVSSGMIRVSIVVEGYSSQGEVALLVDDSGHGIKKENLDKLFIPFFTTSPQGTGLGLSISHKIVEAHRGRIEVTSEERRFTRFSVILPLAKE